MIWFAPPQVAVYSWRAYQTSQAVNIHASQKHWNELGNKDPMWAILADPDKKGGKWNNEEFFQTGREDIRRVLKKLDDSGIAFRRGSALDFGCGLGRLSQALSDHFTSVDGVDISASMIAQARSLNKAPAAVRYHLNIKRDLSLFPSATYDFILSRLCLQHIDPQDQLCYISEFVRLLKPDGIADFQTIHAHGVRTVMPNFLIEIYRSLKYRGQTFMPLYGLGPHRVLEAIKSSGALLLRHERSDFEGSGRRFGVDNFVVGKRTNR
jgi:SAM-dependent methyltransferase